MQDYLEGVLAEIHKDVVIHKVGDHIEVFPVRNDEALKLYTKLHEGQHFDIMEAMIVYGRYLLQKKQSKKPNLTIVKK